MSNEVQFYPMNHSDFWARPRYLETGYTFRNGGGEGDMVFTLLEDFNKDECNNVRVLCHSLRTGYTHEETWDDTQYLEGSFRNGEYFHYLKECDWLTDYYKKD